MLTHENMLSAKPSVLRPRFGQISFLNTLPIVLPIQQGRVQLEAEFHYGEPLEMNQALDSGTLDIASVSSFYYLQNGQLDLVPGISISCRKEVGSVLLFSKIDLYKLDGKTIAVPQSSATSVALLKILLAESYGAKANIISTVRPNPLDDCVDAACVFGDQALEVDREQLKYKDLQRFDLGNWWYELTGLPMVFGVWSTNRLWSQSNPQTFAQISMLLKQAVQLGLGKMLVDVVEEAHSRSGLSMERLGNYYTKELSFELSTEHLAGLETFRQLCCKHGLLPR